MACDALHDLCHWFELLLSQGSDCGYFPNAVKCRDVDDSVKAEAEQIFAPLGILVVCNHHYLGEFLSDSAVGDAFVQNKVHQWVADVQRALLRWVLSKLRQLTLL